MNVHQEIMVIRGKKNDPHYRTIIANDGFLKEDDKSTGFGITGYIHEEHACVLAASFDLLEALEKAQRLLTMVATEVQRTEIHRYLSGGFKESVEDACFKDSLKIEEAIRKARGL